MDILATVSRAMVVEADADAVFALLADVPRSIAHFPDVESVASEGGVWRWRLQEKGAGPLRFRVEYGSRYFTEPATRRVWWERVPEIGNTLVDGRWLIEPVGGGTRITMEARFVVTTSFPRLARPAVEAVIARENERLIGLYMENLAVTLRGGDGRVRRA